MMVPLRAIGYWRIDQPGVANEGPGSDPYTILAIRGAQPLDSVLVSYLRRGHRVLTYKGYSQCRFNCGVPNPDMGKSDLTDGVWIWPEGLVHYVEAHGLALPEEFVDCARAHRGKVPKLPPELQDGENKVGIKFDRAVWNSWFNSLTDADRSEALMAPRPRPSPLTIPPRASAGYGARSARRESNRSRSLEAVGIALLGFGALIMALGFSEGAPDLRIVGPAVGFLGIVILAQAKEDD